MSGSATNKIFRAIEPIVRMGGAVHWLHPREKAPIGNNWQLKPVATLAQLKESHRDGYNVGIRLGGPSRVNGDYLHVLDIDIRVDEAAEEAWEALEELFPNTDFSDFPTVQSGSGGKSRHIYFLTSEPFTSRKLAHSEARFVGKDGKKHWEWEIELFGTGKQVAMPPSIHPNGKPYRWITPLDFDAIDIGAGPFISAEDIETALETDDEGPTSTERLGLTLKEAAEMLDLLPLDEWCDDHDGWVKVGMALHHEFDGSDEALKLWIKFSKQSEKFELRECRYRWRTFKDEKDKIVRMATIRMVADTQKILAGFDELEEDDFEGEEEDSELDGPEEAPRQPAEAAETEKDDPDAPDLSIIGRSNVPAPELPLDVFGDVWVRQLQNWAENASAPVDYVAAALLTSAAAVIGNTRWVRVNHGWVEPSTLWMQIIGSPSSNKSPATDQVVKCVTELETYWNRGYGEELKAWQEQKRVAAIVRRKWEKEVTAAVENGGDPIPMPPAAVEPRKPGRKRLRVVDATAEALQMVLADNQRGILYHRDELAGWYQNLERYSGSSDRPLWLEAYGGRDYKVDRVKNEGEPMVIPYMSVCLFGGIQPDKLNEILDSADDGLQARFLPVWPDEGPDGWCETPLDNSIGKMAFEELGHLRMVEGEDGVLQPKVLPLSPSAKKLFREWKTQRKVNDGYVFGKLDNAYGKATGHVAKLALVLEHLYYAAEPFTGEPPTEISLRAMKGAIRLREEYFKVMQKRVYGLHSFSEEDQNANALARYIAANKPKVVNSRSIRRNFVVPGLKGDSTKTDAAIARLVELNWLLPDAGKKPGRGRPAKNFKVNPKLWKVLDAVKRS